MTILEDAARKKGIKPITLLERYAHHLGFLAFPFIARGWMNTYERTNELPQGVVDYCLEILVPKKEVKLLTAGST